MEIHLECEQLDPLVDLYFIPKLRIRNNKRHLYIFLTSACRTYTPIPIYHAIADAEKILFLYPTNCFQKLIVVFSAHNSMQYRIICDVRAAGTVYYEQSSSVDPAFVFPEFFT